MACRLQLPEFQAHGCQTDHEWRLWAMTNVVDSIRHFAHAVREGREPLVSPADGLRNTETVVAIHESARTGQPIEL